MDTSSSIDPDYRPIPNGLEICIDRYAEAWHAYRVSRESFRDSTIQRLNKARTALNAEIRKAIDAELKRVK